MKRPALKIAFFILFLFITATARAAAPGQIEETKTTGGIKATLKINVKDSMIDLYLFDQKDKKEITEARVTAIIKRPDGKTVTKDLLGMKMGTAYSFMNTLDFGAKGAYVFDIKIETGTKKTGMKFSINVK